MSRFQILADELNNDPLGRGYSGMTDAQAADDINSLYRDVNYPIGIADLELAIRESLKWSEYRERQQAKTEANPGNQGVGTFLNPNMAEFMDLFFTTSSSGGVDGSGQVDLQGAYMNGLIDRMVAEGSMGPAVADALRDYGVQTVSRGTELEIGIVTEGDVKYSRSL